MIFDRDMVIAYIVIAFSTLLIGIAANWMIGDPFSEPVNPLASIYILALIYFVLHLAACALAILVSSFLDQPARSVVLIIASSAALILSLVFTRGMGGISIFIIYSASLVLISTYYFWTTVR